MPLLGTFAAGSARGTGRAARPLLPPNVPTSFSATGVSADNDSGGAVIAFTAPSTEDGLRPITGYEVQNTSTSIITAIAGSGATVPLPKNTTHTFRMRAIGPGGVGDWTSTDNALSFRQTYGGGNGYWNAQNLYVTIPTGTTIGFQIQSGSGQYATPDTRVYGTVYYVQYANYDDFYGTGFGSSWQSGVFHPYSGGYSLPSSRSAQGAWPTLSQYSWYGYDTSWNYLYGRYITWFGSPPNEYLLIYTDYAATNNLGIPGNANIGAVYASNSYTQNEVVSGAPPYPADQGDRSYIYNNGTNTLVAQTNLGFNGTPSYGSGTFTVVGGQIYLALGGATYNYPLNTDYNPGPSGRGRIWYGT
jgi:hypothetical protein